MKKTSSLFVLSFLVSGLFFASSVAAFDFTANDRVNISKPASDDLYIMGGEVTVDQNVNGDVVVFGGDVTIFGDVSGDVLVIGGKISVAGNVKDDVRMMGGSLSVKGNVGDDVVAMGGNITIERGANVNGSVLAAGGLVSVDGNVHEDIKGEMDMLRVRGWVDRNMEIASGVLVFSESAIVKGNLRYVSRKMAVIPDNVVKGTITKGGPILGFPYTMSSGFFPLFRLIELSWMLLSSILLGLFFFLALPEEMVAISRDMREKFWKNLGIGFAIMIGLPVVAILFAVTIIGLPVAMILGFGLGIASFIIQIPVGLFIADFLFKKKTDSKSVLFGRFSVGYLLLSLVRLIPIFGSIFFFLISLLALGAFGVRRYQMFGFLRAKKYW
ncbi:MAG: hypothetical protein AAB551_02715 [Patescibacteria group bacterium]